MESVSLESVLLQMASTASLKSFQEMEDKEEQEACSMIYVRSDEQMAPHNGYAKEMGVTVVESIKNNKTGKVRIKTRNEKVKSNEIHRRLSAFRRAYPIVNEIIALGRLHGVVEPLTNKLVHFILNEDHWGDRLEALTDDVQKQWLQDNATLVIKDVITVEGKHNRLISDKIDNFVNPTIKALIIALVEKRTEVAEAVEGINAAFKDQRLTEKQIEEDFKNGVTDEKTKNALLLESKKMKVAIMQKITNGIDQDIAELRKLIPRPNIQQKIEQINEIIPQLEKQRQKVTAGSSNGSGESHE